MIGCFGTWSHHVTLPLLLTTGLSIALTFSAFCIIQELLGPDSKPPTPSSIAPFALLSAIPASSEPCIVFFIPLPETESSFERVGNGGMLLGSP